MSSNNTPIPQVVNISHALTAATIHEMRNILETLQDITAINEVQTSIIKKYIKMIEDALTSFQNDNSGVQIGINGATENDIQLINGLINMYKEYLSKFTALNDKTIHGHKTEPSNVNLDAGVKALRNHGQEVPVASIQEIETTTNEDKASKLKQTKTKKRKDSAPRPEIYIADVSNKNKSNDTTELVDSQEIDNKNEVVEEKDNNKKKISFTKYLKKEDSSVENSNGSNKRSISDDDIEMASDSESNKRAKLDNGESKIRSILKNTEITSTAPTKKKKRANIKFSDDTSLVTVYGDDLPIDGLKVNPVELKKMLRPFKEGEPNEKLLIEDFSFKPLLLKIEMTDDISDISEIKNGPIACDTRTPLIYRDNFKNFTKELKRPPKEPIPEMEASDINQAPLVAKAFGRNGLLLRKDRGGISYKSVPDVRRNEYPPRHVR